MKIGSVYFLFFMTLLSFVSIDKLCSEPIAMPEVYDIPLPDSLTLCGERVPLENPYVWEMLDREFTIMVWDRAQIFMWLKRANRYFPHIESKLADRNMPDDLKFLAIAESSLLINIRSRKGALGPWQFMPYTAKQHGLRKDDLVDERRSIHDSTLAALKYLQKLKKQFGSWILAMAAYNCGENGLSRAISEQKVSNYFRLNLPQETERYIFRIAAIKIILNNPAKYGYHIQPENMYRPLNEERDTVHLRMEHTVEFIELANALKSDYKTLKEMNPHIIGKYLPTGQYLFSVPKGLGPFVEDKIKKIIYTDLQQKRQPPSLDSSVYTVQPGDTLSRISIKTKVPLQALKYMNRIEGTHVLVGQKLRIK